MPEVKTNSKAAIDFLKKFHPNGPWALTCIAVDKKSIDGATFMPAQEAEAFKWIEKYNGKRNLYFHVNETMGTIERKADKTQIKSAGWLYVDVDCEEVSPDDPDRDRLIEEEKDRILKMFTKDLPKGIPEPTVIISSGGGFQAFWKLKTLFPIEGTEENWEKYEAFNKRLEQVFNGDHCHNVDRIMRLPGTINIPNALKIKKGRVEALARVMSFSSSLSYDLEEKFIAGGNVQTKGSVIQDASIRPGGDINMDRSDEIIADLSELDEWDVPERVKVIIAQGRHPDQPKNGDNSRSAWVFDAVCHLIRCGVPDGLIYSILMDKGWGISESVLEQKDPSRYAIKQISSAHGLTTDPDLHGMNARHAVIGNIGGKCRVIEEVPDEIMGRSRITYASFEDIRNRYNNQKVVIGKDKENKPITMPLGNYWIGHKQRQQFDYIRFMPEGAGKNIFNLWRGFAFAPKQGNCDLYLQHLLLNICKGNQFYYDYLIKWMARAVQKPASQGQVAIVLRGGKGVGKSLMATVFGKLFGRHHLHISNPSHLVGNFNSHLKDSIVLFADEAFFAGDRKHESVLKMLITEDTIPIEQKHVDVEPYPNYIHLIMAANDPHVIRATGDERRYFVLEVGADKQQNSQYFVDLMAQMESGGYEALLYMLQNVDLHGFQVRDVPQTEALQEQKQLSMSHDEEWWFRKLQDGRLLQRDSKWTGNVECEALITDFTRYAEVWKISRRGNETSLGRFLNRVAPHVKRSQTSIMKDFQDEAGYVNRKSVRGYVYSFGSLQQCRDSWSKINGKVEWEEYTQTEMSEEQPF